MPQLNPSVPPESAANPLEGQQGDTHVCVARAAPAASGPMRLLSKADVCAVYGISVRCLENWVNQGRVPAPMSIGGRRYWHPDGFYRDLAARMGLAAVSGASSGAEPTKDDKVAPAPKVARAKRPGRTGEPHPAAARLVTRQESLVDAMNRRLGLSG